MEQEMYFCMLVNCVLHTIFEEWNDVSEILWLCYSKIVSMPNTYWRRCLEQNFQVVKRNNRGVLDTGNLEAVFGATIWTRR